MANPANIGGRSTPHDGTEGYASIVLKIKDQFQIVSTIETIGYFVKIDRNLRNYFDIQYPSGFNPLEDPRFFIYFYCKNYVPDFELQQTTITVYLFNKVKECTIPNNDQTKPVLLKKPHIFLLNTHNNKLNNKKEFKDFFKKYSKCVNDQPLSGGNYEFQGVQKNSAGHPESVTFKAVLDSNNRLYIQLQGTAGVFEKLVSGPLLCKEGSNWNLVGSYIKENNRIVVHHLRAQEPDLYIWKDQDSCQQANVNTLSSNADEQTGADQADSASTSGGHGVQPEQPEASNNAATDMVSNQLSGMNIQDQNRSREVEGSLDIGNRSSESQQSCQGHDVHRQTAEQRLMVEEEVRRRRERVEERATAVHPRAAQEPESIDYIKNMISKLKLHEKIGGQWKFVGGSLSVEDYTLDNIGRNYQSVEEKSMEMLKKWMRGSSEVSTKTLIAALEHYDRNDLAREVKEYRRTNPFRTNNRSQPRNGPEEDDDLSRPVEATGH